MVNMVNMVNHPLGIQSQFVHWTSVDDHPREPSPAKNSVYPLVTNSLLWKPWFPLFDFFYDDLLPGPTYLPSDGRWSIDVNSYDKLPDVLN
jgi:hypothetical protein